MKNINSIQSLIIAGLMANIDSHRVQEMVEHFSDGMDAMRLALYLNGTISKPEDSEIQVTLTGAVAQKIAYNGNEFKDVVVEGKSYDFWEDRVHYLAKASRIYYFKTQEDADKYEQTGDSSHGSYWKREEYPYSAWHATSNESYCSLETWQNAVAQLQGTKYELCA